MTAEAPTEAVGAKSGGAIPTADPAEPIEAAGAAAVTEPIEAASPPLPAGRPRARTRRSRRRLRLLLVFAVLIAAVAYLLVEGLGSSLDYFDTVHQALAHRSSIGTSTIRLEGVVVPGSIHRTARGAAFTVSGGGEHIVVHNVGSPPQLFQQDIPVVVVGHFASPRSSVFESDDIMVKHSQTYVAQHPQRVRAPNGTVH